MLAAALALAAAGAGTAAEPAAAHKWPYCGHGKKWYVYPGWYYLVSFQQHYTAGPSGVHYHRYNEYYGIFGGGPSYIFLQHDYWKRC